MIVTDGDKIAGINCFPALYEEDDFLEVGRKWANVYAPGIDKKKTYKDTDRVYVVWDVREFIKCFDEDIDELNAEGFDDEDRFILVYDVQEMNLKGNLYKEQVAELMKKGY